MHWTHVASGDCSDCGQRAGCNFAHQWKKRMNKKRKTMTRVLRELCETAAALSAYGLASKADMTRIEALCEAPRRATPRHDVSLVIVTARRNA